MTQPVCERCGRLAQVHITSRIGGQEPMRHFCLACADETDSPLRVRERNMRRVAALIVAGGFVFLFSLFADEMGFGRRGGFDWKQDTALALGVVLIGAGALTRASTLLAIGGLIAAVGAIGLWKCLGEGSAFGIKQACGLVLGLAMITGGIIRAWRAS
jgi:hypothetical protein